MQKTESQLSGYLYRRGIALSSSWTNRFVTLSTDTGAMKFYIEKSGKKTVKSQVNVKKGKWTSLDQAVVGKSFAFEVQIDELAGKSEDSIMTLCAVDQSQFDQWKESIESCFTLGNESRRRKSVMSSSMENMVFETPSISLQPVVSTVSTSNATDMTIGITDKSLHTLEIQTNRAIIQPLSPSNIRSDSPVVRTRSKSMASLFGSIEEDEVSAQSTVEESTNIESKSKILSVESSTSTLFRHLNTVGGRTSVREEVATGPACSQSQSVAVVPTVDPHCASQIVEADTQASFTVVDGNGEVPLATPVPINNKGHRYAASSEISETLLASLERGPVDTACESPQKDAFLNDGGDSLPMLSPTPTNPLLLKAAMSAAKPYKVPKFKNLLNSNGFDPNDPPLLSPTSDILAAANASARSSFALEDKHVVAPPSSPPVAPSVTAPPRVSPPPAVVTKYRKIITTLQHLDLDSAMRPADGVVRMGYLFKLDTASREHGEEAWMSQYVTVDVTSGVFTHFAEINGRRIQRGKFDLSAHDVRTVDKVFHGKLFAFRITGPAPSPGQKEEVIATFAAEDQGGLNYWLNAFEDTVRYPEEQAVRRVAEEEEEKKKQLTAPENPQQPQEEEEEEEVVVTHEVVVIDIAKSFPVEPLPVMSDASLQKILHKEEEEEEDRPLVERSQRRHQSYTPFQKSESSAALLTLSHTEDEGELSASSAGSPDRTDTAGTISNMVVSTPSRSSLVAATVKALAKNPSFHFPKSDSDSPVQLAPLLAPLEQSETEVPASPLDLAIKSLAQNPSFHFNAVGSGASTSRSNSRSNSHSQKSVKQAANHDSVRVVNDLSMLFDDPPPPPPTLQQPSQQHRPSGSAFHHNIALSAPSTPHGSDHSHHIFSHHPVAGSQQGVMEHQLQVAADASGSAGHSHNINTASLASIFGTVSALDNAAVDREMGVVQHTGGRPSLSIDPRASPIGDYQSGPTVVVAPQIAPSTKPPSLDLAGMQFVVKKVRYPADRLARRIKIWYCSSGFSLSTESSIQQFVSELRLTGDSTLESFADEQFDHILDWANLLEVLRKYEQRLMLEAPPASHGDRTDEVVSFSVEASLVVRGGQQKQPVQPVVFELGETFSVDSIAEQLSSHFGVSRSEMAAQLPGLLTREGDNPLTKGLGLLKDDLTFAEDLILYQEEVIDHLWDSYTVLKTLVTQRDEVINQLYSQVAELKDAQSRRGGGEVSSSSGGGGGKLRHESSPRKQTRFLEENDFSAIDTDGDGQISREEWRHWVEEKRALIQQHNEAKASLIGEIRTLRKTLNPSTEQAYLELKRSENARATLEEELVRAHIQSDGLKSEVTQLREKLQDAETERHLVEADWQERLANALIQIEGQQRATASPPRDNSVARGEGPAPVIGHGVDREVASKNIYNYSMELKEAADDEDDEPPGHPLHYLSQEKGLVYGDLPGSGLPAAVVGSSQWLQKYMTAGDSHALLGSDRPDAIYDDPTLHPQYDYRQQATAWSEPAGEEDMDLQALSSLYSADFAPASSRSRPLSRASTLNTEDPYSRSRTQSADYSHQPQHQSHAHQQQQTQHDYVPILTPLTKPAPSGLRPSNGNRVATRPDNNTYDLTGATDFTSHGAMNVRRDANPALTDHPLRNALRNDTINKLNGNGKALAQVPKRQGFAFNPRAGADSVHSGGAEPVRRVVQQPFSPMRGATTTGPGSFRSPAPGSATTQPSPHRFMLNTDSWTQKSAAGRETVNPASLQRSSGGWKFA